MISFLTMGCEVDTALTIRDGNPPIFVMTGSGRLVRFRVLGPKKQREGLGNISDAYWEIVPAGGEKNGKGVSEIRSVTYGKVPDGYIQIYPEKGEAPQLIEEEHYQAVAITYNANSAIKGFIIQNGKAIEDASR